MDYFAARVQVGQKRKWHSKSADTVGDSTPFCSWDPARDVDARIRRHFAGLVSFCTTWFYGCSLIISLYFTWTRSKYPTLCFWVFVSAIVLLLYLACLIIILFWRLFVLRCYVPDNWSINFSAAQIFRAAAQRGGWYSRCTDAQRDLLSIFRGINVHTAAFSLIPF